MTSWTKFCTAIDRFARAIRIVAALTLSPKFFRIGCVPEIEAVPVYTKFEARVPEVRVSKAFKPYCVPSGSFPCEADLRLQGLLFDGGDAE